MMELKLPTRKKILFQKKEVDDGSMKIEYVDVLTDYWRNNLTSVFKRKKDLDV